MAQLNFKGKPFVQNEHLGVKYHELVPKNNKSLTAKKQLVFTLTKYLDQDYLDELRIVFAQLPFEIYKLAG